MAVDFKVLSNYCNSIEKCSKKKRQTIKWINRDIMANNYTLKIVRHLLHLEFKFTLSYYCEIILQL